MLQEGTFRQMLITSLLSALSTRDASELGAAGSNGTSTASLAQQALGASFLAGLLDKRKDQFDVSQGHRLTTLSRDRGGWLCPTPGLALTLLLR